VTFELRYNFKIISIYLFEYELKLGRVQQQLEQNFGIVFGVIDNLLFDLTQSLVVWIISFKKTTTTTTITLKSILMHYIEQQTLQRYNSFQIDSVIKAQNIYGSHPGV